MSRAMEIMKQLNPNALVGNEGDHVVFLEDHVDPDGRMFRLEVQSTPDGKRAVAYCRHSPWGNNPHDYSTSHLGADGAICLGTQAAGNLTTSTMDVATAILRARFWCTAFSVLMETGEFPQPEGARA